MSIAVRFVAFATLLSVLCAALEARAADPIAGQEPGLQPAEHPRISAELKV